MTTPTDLPSRLDIIRRRDAFDQDPQAFAAQWSRQQAKLRKVLELGRDRLGIPEDHLEPYGHYKAKISLEFLEGLKAGERIVVEGLLKARPGSEVKPVAASLPAGK